MNIEDYIETCRTIYPRDIISNIHIELLAEYENIYSGRFNVKFKAVATIEKESSILKIGEEKFLLFDLYLLQELASLNSIMFYERSKEEKFGLIYSFKTLAENLLFRRQYSISNKFINLHTQFSRTLISAELDELITDKVIEVTHIQGKYIAAHEYGHLIFDDQTDQRSQLWKNKFKRFIYSKFPKHIFTSKSEEKIRKLHVRKMNEAHGNNFSVLPGNNFRMPMEKISEKLDELAEDDSLLEEMICDEIALKLLFFESEIDAYEVIATSALVFLYHLRYFAIADRYSYGLKEEESIYNLLFSMDIRVRALTKQAYISIDRALGSHVAKSWINNFRVTEKAHMDKITYQMIFPAWTVLKKEFKDSSNYTEAMDVNKELSLRQSIIKKLP